MKEDGLNLLFRHNHNPNQIFLQIIPEEYRRRKTFHSSHVLQDLVPLKSLMPHQRTLTPACGVSKAIPTSSACMTPAARSACNSCCACPAGTDKRSPPEVCGSKRSYLCADERLAFTSKCASTSCRLAGLLPVVSPLRYMSAALA